MLMQLTSLLAQVQTTAPVSVIQTLLDSWLSSKDAGVATISLILNAIELYVIWYLLNKLMKANDEKSTIISKHNDDSRSIFNQVLENQVEVTKALTELSVVIRSGVKS